MLYIEDYIRENIGKPLQFLGAGAYGEVWLLDDGSVVKLTRSGSEKNCVEILFDIQEQEPEKYSKFFPEIYAYGSIPEDQQTLLTRFSLSGYRNFNFWYQREQLLDVYVDSQYSADLEEDFEYRIGEFINNVYEAFGIDVQDTHIDNFGIREGNPDEIIFRDLQCRPSPYSRPRKYFK